MAEPLGTYSFLPYLRIGLPNAITQPDQDPVKLRATFDLQLTLEGKSVSGGPALKEVVTRPVQLYGPADIVGIDKRVILKSEPRNWVTNFEPNYLPYIDFYEEDFPWRYTPSKADEGAHRLRPWIALVVLEEGEFTEGKNVKGKPLPFIHVENAATKFPPAAQLHAWAHVHVNRDLEPSGNIESTAMDGVVLPALESALKSNPDVAYSRILCPRRLKASAAYHCFLIPSFEGGRQAGLGLEINPDFASQYAWGQTQVDFPYYHRWHFRTGTAGDFEYLVRLLKPQTADERVGRREFDVQDPGWNIDGLDPAGPLGGILKLGGALRLPPIAIKNKKEFEKYENWAVEDYPQPIQEDIAAFLNLADDYQKPGANPQPIPDADNPLDPDPLITPPLYGRWHAAVDRLLTKADGTPAPHQKNWIHELNLDPRFRIPAGFGTKVIQENQEEYMNVAWQQVGDVVKANHLLRLAQLARETMWQWHTRTLQPLATAQAGRLMMLTAPVQKRILIQNATVFHRVRLSRVPPVALSAQMRRMTRPRARLMKQLPFAEKNIAPETLVARLNDGEILPAPPKVTPGAIQTEDVLAENIQPPPQPQWLVELMERYPWLMNATLIAAILIILLLLLLRPPLAIAIVGALIAGGLLFLYRLMRNIVKRLAEPDIFKESGQTPETVDQAPKSPDFHITEPSDTFRPSFGTTDSAEGVQFKLALKEMYAVDIAAAAAAFEPPKEKLNLDVIATGTLATLHPDYSIARLVLDRIFLPDRIKQHWTPEQFDEIQAYPRFDLPMYKPLADSSSEKFLPNINLIPQNSITLLETNQKLIEAYMVGINHEMSRELLWREYPTDQRGSYFRQFWDVSAYLPETEVDEEELKESLKDIPEIHRWPRASELGDHDHRETGGKKEEEVVLVIRGELLKKYPTAVIYAHKARWQLKKNDDGLDVPDNSKERDLVEIPSGQEDKPPRTILKTPLYSAKVDPDIYFFGFDLTAEEAKGKDGSEPEHLDKAGWFFVIKERPGEPRFGLDIGGPTEKRHTWSDLTWADVKPAVPEGGFLQISNDTVAIGLEKPTDQTQAEFDEQLEQYEEDKQIEWNSGADAADLAYVLYQVPVMVAVHASEMLVPA